MSASDGGINYAKALGFHSTAAAILFSVLYVPLLARFLRQSFSRPTYVYFVLSLFCATQIPLVRVAAFAIRAVLCGSRTAGEDLSLVIADGVLFGVGYFGLLYSAYTLVLDIELLSKGPPSRQGPIMTIIKNRVLFRLALTAAVACGIASSTINNGQGSTASALRKASIIIFLTLTALNALQTIILAKMEYSGESNYRKGHDTFGRKHGIVILLVISALLLVREGFTTVTIFDVSKLNNESLWYPLVALPEILAVILYATPDLVPKREEFSTVDR